MIVTKEIRRDVVDFVTAAPGWRLFVADGSGEYDEESLVGWVTVAKVEVDRWVVDDREKVTRTGTREILPGWISEGAVITTAHGKAKSATCG